MQLLDTYAMNFQKVLKLNSNFKTSGKTPGWASVDFDKTGNNLAISGIFKDATQTYLSVISVNKALTSINWMKYFKKKVTSTMTLRMDEVEAHYDASLDRVVVVVHATNTGSLYYPNIINIYSLNMSDGAKQWEIQFADYGNNKFSFIRSTVNPYLKELNLFYTNTAYDYYHVQAVNLKDGAMLSNLQVEIFKHYAIDGITVFPPGSSNSQSNDILMTAVDGYVMKMNTRKANLDIIDKTSLFRPLYGIHYNNFTLALTTPTDIEPISYTPAFDFMIEETGYEVIGQSTTYQEVTAPNLELITDMAIYFSDTNKTVNVPNSGKFNLSQPHTKGNLRDDFISVTFELFTNSE